MQNAKCIMTGNTKGRGVDGAAPYRVRRCDSMKIRCTKKEFAQLVRACEGEGRLKTCTGCVLADVCGQELIEDAGGFEIEGDA